MSSILRKITVLTVISVALVLVCGQITHAAIWLSVAQGATAALPPDGNPNLIETPRAPHYENPKIYIGERISLDFQNADVHNIIRIIGEVSGKNIVVSDAVTGKVTLKLSDVPWDQALDIVLSTRNLGVEEAGNVLTIYDLPTLNSIQAGRQRLISERATAQALAPLAKKIFTPKYSPLSMVTTELTKLKSDRGKIVSIGNDIYVEDDPGILATMTQLFMKIDRVARQILIEARIVEATSTFISSLGVTWGAKSNTGGLPETEFDGSGAYVPGGSAGSLDINKAGISLGFGFLNKSNSLLLNAQLNAAETSSDSRTISAPRIMAANDQEVSIKQGQQIPYQSGSSATTAANVQFKDVVMELKVKPHIEENGQIITLEIELTNDTLAASSPGEEPAINTREAETVLMVRDGETVVIGGIIVDSQTTGISRVPVIHRIPLFGWMFQNRDINQQKTELLIFITANIIPLNI